MTAVGERIRRDIDDANDDRLVEPQLGAADRPGARGFGVAGEEAPQLGREARELRRRAVVAGERREPARRRRDEGPALPRQDVGPALRAPMHERFALGFGDLFEEDDQRLHTGRREPGGLRFPTAGRERRAHRLGGRGVRGERGDSHAARSALTMFRRAARSAGRNPPTIPITKAKIMADAITLGERAKPTATSEKLAKLSVEIRAKESSEARPMPAAPPAIASTIDSARNATRMLRRWNPRARIVPTSTTRFATAAYIVIIAPIIAPMLKMTVTTMPRRVMNVAI